jgi:hypothetical protein
MPRSNMPRWRKNAGNTWKPPFVIGFLCATNGQKPCDSRPSRPTISYDVPPKALEYPGVEARSMSRALPSSMTCRSGKRWTFHAFNSSRPS